MKIGYFLMIFVLLLAINVIAGQTVLRVVPETALDRLVIKETKKGMKSSKEDDEDGDDKGDDDKDDDDKDDDDKDDDDKDDDDKADDDKDDDDSKDDDDEDDSEDD
ncbi:uncharacterized protein LOC130664389 [Microplitis mediator]|uniref:uncharacterized protein LOC130664389 n=1 Tax=Microplitis mediator TaxID=375433 RepID=UPI0025528622|nr:uncharacterized protein LOC130664389 [Microplitis mediator]